MNNSAHTATVGPETNDLPPSYSDATTKQVPPPPPPANYGIPVTSQGQTSTQYVVPSAQYNVQTQGTQQQHTVIISQPRMSSGPTFEARPMTMSCPYCFTEVTTDTKKRCGALVWSIVGYLCLIGLGLPCIWLGCCLIPFCIPSLYDVEHTCPSCKKVIGRRPGGGVKF